MGKAENEAIDVDDFDGDFAGGMTERNVETARKLIPDSDFKNQKNQEQQEADDCEIEPAINHDADTAFKPDAQGNLISNENAVNKEIVVQDEDDDDSDDSDSDDS